jgi:hypothetical protein
VQDLGHDHPKTTKVLLDIATRHTYGEEAVEVVFIQGKEKLAPISS